MKIAIDPQDQRFRTWSIDELYTGPTGKGVMVPNVEDAVLSWEDSSLYRVVAVDGITKIPVLGPPRYLPQAGVTEDGVFIGNGGGHVSETFRMNLDKSTLPHRASLDSRVRIYGTAAVGVRIFMGVDTTQATGQVISSYYDQSGNLESDLIPLEVVAMDNINNTAIKAMRSGSVTYDLSNGELVTVVVYDEAGSPMGESRFLCRNTALTYAKNTKSSPITGIYLRSNFLSKTDDRTLLFPVNVPVADVDLTAVVKYGGGREREVAVNGSKVALRGLEDFVSSQAGQRLPLTLTYMLDDDEVSDLARVGAGRHITERYYLASIPMDGAYSVKLFVCPQWVDAQTGYELRYYLFDLDGTRRLDVTNFVRLGSTSATYRPTSYGTEQRLSIVLELNDAVPGMGAHRHVQSFAITLYAPAYEAGTPWTISYAPGIPDVYGIGIQASTSINQSGDKLLNISNNFGSQSEWTNRLYYDTKPLYGGSDMPAPREPTHFEISVNGHIERISIEEWDADIVIPEAITIETGSTVFVSWVLETLTNDIWLAQSSLTVRDETVATGSDPVEPLV